VKRARQWRPGVKRAAPWLGLAAVVLGAVGIVDRWDRAEMVQPGASPAPEKPAARRPGAAAVSPPPVQVDPVRFVDLFPHQDWAPPPPPPPQVTDALPTPTQPPPLPFAIGALWLDNSGAFYAVLTAQGREFPVCVACRQSGFYREGDVLLGSYRIDKVTSQEVRFVYLPMKRLQQMSLGG